MNDIQLERRLERALIDDARTHEMGVRVVVAGGCVVASGEVASEERRQAVLAVIREADPGLPVADQLTLAEPDAPAPGGHERIVPPRS